MAPTSEILLKWLCILVLIFAPDLTHGQNAVAVRALVEGRSGSGITSPRPNGLLPPWFNATAFAEGQRFGSKHFFAQFFGPIMALSMFLSFPDSKSVLVSTGRSDTAEKAGVRYVATMEHLRIWLEDIAQPGEEISPRLLDSLQYVRRYHEKVAQQLDGQVPFNSETSPPRTVDAPFWEAVAQDLEESNIPVEQRQYPAAYLRPSSLDSAVPFSHLAMSLTQWMFAAPQTLVPEACGIYGATDDEFDGLRHFWAVLGYALGLEDEYNVGLGPDLAYTRKVYREIFETYFVPSLFQIDHEGKVLWESFFDGFVEAIFGNTLNRLVKKDQFMILALEEFLGIPAINVRARIGATDSVLNTAVDQLMNAHRFGQPVRGALNSLLKRFYFDANAN